MKSSRHLSRIFTILLFIISLIFSYFLLQSGSLLIENLPKVSMNVTIENFINEDEINKIEESIDDIKDQYRDLEYERDDWKSKKDEIERNIGIQEKTYQDALDSRIATENSRGDKSIEESRVKLIDLRSKLKEISKEYQIINSSLDSIRKQQIEKENEINKLYEIASKILGEKQNILIFKAFIIRLSFVLPLLLISIFLLKKYRKSNYWPFVYGWGYFSLYAFFIELIPYFPSYGGYVRSAIGLILCFIIGKIIIQKLQSYLEQKRKFELEDEGERRSKLLNKESNLEAAFSKINKNICPSCDRGFSNKESKYCVFCGLCIKKNCSKCDKLQISFNKYCLECGEKQEEPHLQLEQT